MDDATETDVLYEAASILLRLSVRSFHGLRADIKQIELPPLATSEEYSGYPTAGPTLMPLMLALFSLGLVSAAARNEHVQGFALLLTRLLRRQTRRLKTALTRLALSFGPGRKTDLLQLQLKSPGSTWDHRSVSGQAACFALQGRRAKMEDRFTLIEKLGGTALHLYAIYDGHGGEFAADFAQRWIVNWLEKRSTHYKPVSRPQFVQQSSVSLSTSSSGVQEIRQDNTSTSSTIKAIEYPLDPAPQSESCDVVEAELSSIIIGRRKSQQIVQQQGENAGNKTPSFKRRQSQQQQIQEGQSADSSVDQTPSNIRRTSSAGRSKPPPLAKSSKSHEMKRMSSSAASNNEFDLSTELNNAIVESDKALLVEAKRLNDVAGSTALVALFDSARCQLTVANVGDSRGILCDAKGTVIPLSFDHKPQQLKERKRIQEAGGFIAFNGVWRVAGILATSRALGDFPLKDRKLLIAEPDVLSFDLQDLRLSKPSFLILASDGLWDAFTNEEAALYVRERLHEPHLGAKSLAMQAYQRGSVDNITVLVIDLSKL